MAQFTRKAIIQTFQDMLAEMPFDKITILALVSRCEISPNTFYYHFRDIYDLLDAWFKAQEESLFQEKKPTDNMYDVLKTLMLKMQANPEIVYHVFNSFPRERIEKQIFDVTQPIFIRLLKNRPGAPSIPEETLKMVSSFYCFSFLGFIIEFIWEKMEGDVETKVARLQAIFENLGNYPLGTINPD